MIPKLNPVQIVATGLTSAICVTIFSRVTHGIILGGVVLIGLFGSQKVIATRTETSDSQTEEPIRSLQDVTEKEIRERLDHPDITSIHPERTGSGGWRVSVECIGPRNHVERIVAPEFSVLDTVPDDEGGCTAMLELNADSFV